jgi:hypothetical protein
LVSPFFFCLSSLFSLSLSLFPSLYTFVMVLGFNNKPKDSSSNGDVSPTTNDVDGLSVHNVESGSKGQFKEFIKTVISFTGDLSSLTCPAFFLNGLSLLEYG